jgi:hypothetical protein
MENCVKYRTINLPSHIELKLHIGLILSGLNNSYVLICLHYASFHLQTASKRHTNSRLVVLKSGNVLRHFCMSPLEIYAGGV